MQDTTSVAQAQNADEFEQLFRRSYRRAYNLAYRLTGNATEAEDITQDAYFRAWSRFYQYEHSRSFESWLFRIITNLVIDHHRQERRANIISLNAPIFDETGAVAYQRELTDQRPTPEELIIENLLETPLQAALDSLSPIYRAAIILADIGDESYEEIAQVMGCAIGTVRSRIHRARRLMRRYLEKHQSSSSANGTAGHSLAKAR